MQASKLIGHLLPFPAAVRQRMLAQQIDVAVAIYSAIAFGFVCSGSYTMTWASLTVPFLGLAALGTDSRTVRFGALLGITGVMAALVATNYYYIANHGFMLVWCGLALAFAVACDPGRDVVVLRRNAALLLGILMGFALIQKLRAPYYMDGDLLGGLLMEGEIYFNFLSWLIPEWPGLVADYTAKVDGLLAAPEVGSVSIAVPAFVTALAWRLTLGSLVAQGVLEVMILLRSRVGLLLHVAILGFVAAVYGTRGENLFLSINCLLGYCMTDERSVSARPFYVLAVIYLLATGLIGLRPWIIS
jgi:hypothetical protein